MELRTLFRHASIGIEYAVRLVVVLPIAKPSDFTSLSHSVLADLVQVCRRQLMKYDIFLISSEPLQFRQTFVTNALSFEQTAAMPYNFLLAGQLSTAHLRVPQLQLFDSAARIRDFEWNVTEGEKLMIREIL